MANRYQIAFVVRALLAYAVCAWIVIEITDYSVQNFDVPAVYAFVVEKLSYSYGLVVLYLVGCISVLSRSNRKLAAVWCAWLYWPLFLGVAGFLLIAMATFDLPESIGWLLYALMFFVAIVWVLVSMPFARKWAYGRSDEPDALRKFEGNMSWPFKPREIRDIEPDISPALYYSLIAGIAAILFIMLESWVSEFLDEMFALPGYLGATMLGFAVAASIYPVHIRMNKYVSYADVKEKEAGVTSLRKAVGEVAGSFKKIAHLFIRRWDITVASLITIHYVTKWIVRLS